MSEVVQGRVLHAGSVEASVIRLTTPLSFWGGFDPTKGTIIDQTHPQVGASLAGLVVVMPGSRGSSGTPGVLAESIRRRTGPAGLLVEKADINLTAGAVVEAALYGRACPIVLLARDELVDVARWNAVVVSADGVVAARRPASGPPAHL